MNSHFTTQDRLQLEQVRQLYDLSPIATMGAITVSIVTGVMLWSHVSTLAIVAWVVSTSMISLIRHFIAVRFNRTIVTTDSAGRWRSIFIICIFISGIVWGSSALFIFPENSPMHQVFLFFMLGGMAAGGLGAFSVVRRAFLAFTLPELIPMIIRLFSIGTPIHTAMGGIVLCFLVLITLTAYYMNTQTVTAISLKFENLDLIDDLKEAKKNVEELVCQRTAALSESNENLKQEIQERAKAESALKTSEERYRLLVENANDAIFVYQKGKICFHNKRTEKLGGYSGAELENLKVRDLVHPDDRALVAPLFSSRQSEMKPTGPITVRIQSKGKDQIWGQITAVGITWGNSPATLCFARDITIQKQLEDHLFHAQKMEAIGTLAGGIAHDFNNILTGIMANASLLLLKTEKDHPQRKKMKDIEALTHSGANLTRQLLGFARNTPYEIKPESINPLIDKTLKMFKRTKKEIQVDTSYEQGLPAVKANQGQLEQAFLNIFVNAWHAMPGGGRLYIETSTTALTRIEGELMSLAPGTYVQITIEDSGIGMDETILPKIFDPFFTTKDKSRGTGLGLASTYGIVKNHGGHIIATSRPGEGSSFRIYLPASDKEAVLDQVIEGDILEGNETILLVDDEEEVLYIEKEILEVLGYSVHSAKNGTQALAIYSRLQDNIHLVILDMVMPGMSGNEVYDQLTKINPKVKVLLSSGYSRSGHADKILKKGCNGFIQKPFNINQLSQRIRFILDNKC